MLTRPKWSSIHHTEKIKELKRKWTEREREKNNDRERDKNGGKGIDR